MLKMILRPCVGALSMALVAALAAPAAAGEEDNQIRIHKVHRICDGEDCEHDGEHRAIFVGEDGELTELLGDDALWMGDGEHAMHLLGGSGTFLGVQLTELTDDLRTHFGVPEGQGVMVSKVVDGSPAAMAGVQAGDIVTAVDGEQVSGGRSLGRLIRDRDEGETVALEIYRAGRVETLSPTLAASEGRRMRVHRMHGGPGDPSGLHEMHQVRVRCTGDEDERDCEVTVGDGDLSGFDCGGAEECRVEVRCADDGCECTANGDAVDCDELPGFAERHGE